MRLAKLPSAPVAAHAHTLDHGADLTGLTDDDHTQYLKEEASGGLASEVPDHTHASVAEAGTVSHAVLTGVTSDQHHAQSHVLATGAALGPDHTISGAVAGEVLRALSATTAAFDQLQHADLGAVTADQHHAAVTLAADAEVLLGLTGQQLTLDAQTANLVFAGPTSGGAVDPTFRAMVSADLPAAVVETTDAAWVDLTDAGNTTLHAHDGTYASVLLVDTTEVVPIGTLRETADGRRFRYALVPSGTTTVPGKLYQSHPTSNTRDMALSTEAAGSLTVTVTLSIDAVLINEFAGGSFYVDVPGTAANGSIAYRIASHPAAAAFGTCVLTLETPIAIAIAAADTGSMFKNKYSGIGIHLSPPVAMIAGVAVSVAVGSASTTFAWFQTWGPCSVLTDGTLVYGIGVMPSDATDGAVEAWVPEVDTAGEVETQPIGYCLNVESTGQYSLIDLRIE